MSDNQERQKVIGALDLDPLVTFLVGCNWNISHYMVKLKVALEILLLVSTVSFIFLEANHGSCQKSLKEPFFNQRYSQVSETDGLTDASIHTTPPLAPLATVLMFHLLLYLLLLLIIINKVLFPFQLP